MFLNIILILICYQAYGFDDDEEYDVDDGGDDGMIFLVTAYLH